MHGNLRPKTGRALEPWGGGKEPEVRGAMKFGGWGIEISLKFH